MILFRPVGLEELRLVYDAKMRAFPPRLPDQPIFYPVTNQAYAEQIAREWNTKSGTLAGFVTRFSVDDAYVAKFERRVVGAREHEELWVSAEDLADFNTHIKNEIEVVAAFFGDGYRGFIPDAFGLRGKDAGAQLVALAKTLAYSRMDFQLETSANHTAVFLNYFFWEQTSFATEGIDEDARNRTLEALRNVWANATRPASRLGIQIDAHETPKKRHSDTWSIGLSAWIIQDGNYGDFEVGQETHFAVELEFVSQEAPRVVSARETSAISVDQCLHDLVGRVVLVEANLWVVDAGILMFQEQKPPPGIAVGDFVEMRAYVGIDPFFYFERLHNRASIPPMIYAWRIDRILREMDAGTSAGPRWIDVPATHAWADDEQHAAYVLISTLLPGAPQRTKP